MKVDNHQEKVRQQALNTLPHPIERVHFSSLTPEEFFKQYQRKGIPVVVKGLLDREPDWDLSYLCQHLGNQEFPIRYYGRERYKQGTLKMPSQLILLPATASIWRFDAELIYPNK